MSNSAGTASPEIPQSDALQEASSGDSLAEAMGRDPEGYSRQDRDRIIEALRAHRARIASAEANGGKLSNSAKKADKISLGKVADKPLDEMGL